MGKTSTQTALLVGYRENGMGEPQKWLVDMDPHLNGVHPRGPNSNSDPYHSKLYL